jgi:iduronate 2-sulfatase
MGKIFHNHMPDPVSFDEPDLKPDRYMGYSMVAKRYHYMEWFHWDDQNKTAGEKVGVELYDNQADPDENKELVKSHSRQLKAGWRGVVK